MSPSVSPVRQALAGSDTFRFMKTVILPEGFEEIRREELARAFQKVLRVRYLVQPVLVLIVLYIAFTDSSWYRGVAMLGVVLVALAMTLFEVQRMRRHGVASFNLSIRDNIGIVIALLLGGLLTGGTRSPFTMQLVPALIILANITPSRRLAQIVLCCFLAFLWVLVLIQPAAPWIMPPAFLDASGRTNFAYDLIFVATTSVFAVASCGIGVALRSMSDSLLLRSLEARSEALKLHA